jgi:RND family efflux transporter MFP subunit
MHSSAIQDWLDAYCDASEGIVGGVVMLSNPRDGALVVAAAHAAPTSHGENLIAAAKASFDGGAPIVLNGQDTESGPASGHVISLPVRAGNRSLGAVALELHADSNVQRTALGDLERAASAFAAALASSQAAQAHPDASAVLQLQATLLGHERFEEAATAFATELAAVFHADRATIGCLDETYSTVVAVSRSADFHSKAELFRALCESMDEAIEQGATICFPGDDKPRITVAHAEFVKRYGGSLCTVPLVSRGRAFGALTLERGGKTAFSAEEISRLENAACLTGPIVELKREQQRPWTVRMRRMARDMYAGLFALGHWRTKAAVYGFAAVLAGLLLVPVEYRVSAPARVEGAIQRSLSAPVDGFLRAVHVKPGDKVSADQVLVELAEQDLQLEIRKHESELAQHENAYTAALARSDRTQFVIAQARAEEARAQLGLIEEQLSRSRIRAPFDGIVTTGDLSQSIGAPVQKGNVLLTVAPAKQFRLIVEVDERDIADVRIGQIGAIALSALPGTNSTFRVERITPVAASREGRNFFEVEGKLHATPASLRPGLQGVAKIRSEDRSLAWIWTHRFVDWLRLRLWSWWA